jgi:hypothetical protein
MIVRASGMPTTASRLTIFWTLFLACVLCPACSKTDDSEKIRSVIARGAALAEAHDISGILELATRDVRATPMDLDRRGIKGVLWRTFNYYGPLDILYPRPAVEVEADGHAATARFPFLIVKKGHPVPDLKRLRDNPMAWIEALGETADLYRLRLSFARQGGAWRVRQASLERFTGTGFEE